MDFPDQAEFSGENACHGPILLNNQCYPPLTENLVLINSFCGIKFARLIFAWGSAGNCMIAETTLADHKTAGIMKFLS